MAGMATKIKGDVQIIAALQRLGVDVTEGLELICHIGAMPFEAGAKRNAPDGIDIKRATKSKRGGRRVTVVVGPTRDAFYARWIEYGVSPHGITPDSAQAITLDADVFRTSAAHPGHAAHPFMRPAYDNNKTRAQTAIGDEIAAKVKKVKARQ